MRVTESRVAPSEQDSSVRREAWEQTCMVRPIAWPKPRTTLGSLIRLWSAAAMGGGGTAAAAATIGRVEAAATTAVVRDGAAAGDVRLHRAACCLCPRNVLRLQCNLLSRSKVKLARLPQIPPPPQMSELRYGRVANRFTCFKNESSSMASDCRGDGSAPQRMPTWLRTAVAPPLLPSPCPPRRTD